MKKLTGKGKHNIKVGHHPLTNKVSKLASTGRGEDKCRTMKIHLKLRDQQSKPILYIYRLLYQYRDYFNGNQKPKNYNRHTHNKEKANQIQH